MLGIRKLVHYLRERPWREAVEGMAVQQLPWLARRVARAYSRKHGFYLTHCPSLDPGKYLTALQYLHAGLILASATPSTKDDPVGAFLESIPVRRALGLRAYQKLDAVRISRATAEVVPVEAHLPLWRLGVFLNDPKFAVWVFDEFQLSFSRILHRQPLSQELQTHPDFFLGMSWDAIAADPVAFLIRVREQRSYRSEANVSCFLKVVVEPRDTPVSHQVLFITRSGHETTFCPEPARQTPMGTVLAAETDREHDAERKTLLLLWEFVETHFLRFQNLKKLDAKLYVDQCPCGSCARILGRFEKYLEKVRKRCRKKRPKFTVHAFYLEDSRDRTRTAEDVRRQVINGERGTLEFVRFNP